MRTFRIASGTSYQLWHQRGSGEPWRHVLTHDSLGDLLISACGWGWDDLVILGHAKGGGLVLAMKPSSGRSGLRWMIKEVT